MGYLRIWKKHHQTMDTELSVMDVLSYYRKLIMQESMIILKF